MKRLISLAWTWANRKVGRPTIPAEPVPIHIDWDAAIARPSEPEVPPLGYIAGNEPAELEDEPREEGPPDVGAAAAEAWGSKYSETLGRQQRDGFIIGFVAGALWELRRRRASDSEGVL